MTSLFKSTTTYDPIKTLLNADTEQEKDELTTKWKENKLQELNFVGIVVSLGRFAESAKHLSTFFPSPFMPSD